MAGEIQGAAVVQLGPDAGDLTDYSCYVSEFVIHDVRNLYVKAPSFGSPAVEEKAAAAQATVTMTFLAAPNTASGLWWELNRAQSTRTGELYFDVRWSSAAVSSSNPKRTGLIVVSGLDTGAPPGPRRYSFVFPARNVSGPLAS